MPVANRPTDKRLIKASGKYPSRKELTEACKAFRQAGLTHTQIGELTGVAACTVTRILNGDKKTYKSTNQPAPLTMAINGNIGRLNSIWPAATIPEEFYDDLEHRLGQPARLW